MVRQTATASPMHATVRFENENISHPKLYCCTQLLHERALWPQGMTYHANREHRLEVFYAFGGGGSGAAMRLVGIRRVYGVTIALSCWGGIDVEVPLEKMVPPQEIIAWQHSVRTGVSQGASLRSAS